MTAMVLSFGGVQADLASLTSIYVVFVLPADLKITPNEFSVQFIFLLCQ